VGNPVAGPASVTDIAAGAGIDPDTTAIPDGGTYLSPQSVTLTCGDGSGSGCAATYYTTDGEDPTTSSTLYTGAIDIGEYTVLKYFSVDKAGNQEAYESRTYHIQIETGITCDLTDPSDPLQDPITQIVFGEPFRISGQISPGPNEADEGIAITLTSGATTVELSTSATASGAFSLDVGCDELPHAGTWSVTTAWGGDASHQGATSPAAGLTVTQAESRLTLDLATAEAIKVNSTPPIGGTFARIRGARTRSLTGTPPCWTLTVTEPMVRIRAPRQTLSAATNQYGQYLLDYAGQGFAFDGAVGPGHHPGTLRGDRTNTPGRSLTRCR
jgi:hypothetical protein